MPTYQYECGSCQHAFEFWQSMMDKKLRKCPHCGKFKLHRLIGSGTGIIFKGSGFYETDYKKKQPSPESNPKSSKVTEAKTDTPSSTKSTAAGASKE